MAFEITNSGGLFKIKNTSDGSIKAISKDDVRFKLDDKLTILKGAKYPVLVIKSSNEVTTPDSKSLNDLLTKLNNLT
jgi:hypothetical protein